MGRITEDIETVQNMSKKTPETKIELFAQKIRFRSFVLDVLILKGSVLFLTL